MKGGQPLHTAEITYTPSWHIYNVPVHFICAMALNYLLYVFIAPSYLCHDTESSDVRILKNIITSYLSHDVVLSIVHSYVIHYNHTANMQRHAVKRDIVWFHSLHKAFRSVMFMNLSWSLVIVYIVIYAECCYLVSCTMHLPSHCYHQYHKRNTDNLNVYWIVLACTPFHFWFNVTWYLHTHQFMNPCCHFMAFISLVSYNSMGGGGTCILCVKLKFRTANKYTIKTTDKYKTSSRNIVSLVGGFSLWRTVFFL